MESTHLLLLLLGLEGALSKVIVVTAQGRLQGVVNDGYISFRGIPYASVVGNTGRFKGGGIAPTWTGIREAYYPNCSPAYEASECLHLDVHVPILELSPWPVFVWVRSGTGSYLPRKLVQEGVIVVLVYYRLSPGGFLCLREESIPGNAGAKDVVLALRWVRDNIVAFKGNPAKVVLAGQGFGAAVVHATMLSPMAQGLYHGVILQSGSILSPISFNYDAAERANTLGLMLSDGDETVTSILSSDNAALLAMAAKLDRSYYPFGLCIEKAFKNEERFLDGAPIDLLLRKKFNALPIIIGYNIDEAYIFVSNLKAGKILRRLSADTKFLIPEELKFVNDREIDRVAKQISDTYFKHNISMAAALAYYRDLLFLNHIYRSVRLHAAGGAPVYFYQFSFNGSAGIYPELDVKKTGAAHTDELAYLFSGRDMNGDEGSVQQNLLKLWSNFVKHLNPTPRSGETTTWTPVDLNNLRLLDIGANFSMQPFPHTTAMHLWDDIYDKYYYSRHANYAR